MDFALQRVQDTSSLQNWVEAPHTPLPESKITVWVTDYFTEVIHPTYTEIEGPAPNSWDPPLIPTSTLDPDPFTTPWSSEVTAVQTTRTTESSTPSELPESHTSASETEQPVETRSSSTIESSTTGTLSKASESTTTSKTSDAFDTSTSSDTSTSDSTTTSEASRTSDTTTTLDTSIVPSTSTTESSRPARPSMQPLVTLATAPPLPSQSEPAGYNPAATEYGSTIGEDASGHAGVIAGSIIGGVAFIALTLLACFFCFRRKRQRSQRPKRPKHMREASFDSWNATSLMGSVRVLKYSQFSQPDFVDTDSPPGLGPHAQKHANDQTTGGRPVPYRQRSGIPRQYSNRRYSNPYANDSFNPEMSGANNDISYSDGNPYPNRTNPHRVSSQVSSRWAPSTVSDPFADNEESPVSPILDLNAPSRTVSCYSRASYHGGLNILAHYDGSARDSQCASTYFYPGQLAGESTDLPPAPPVPDGISRTGSMVRGRSQNPSSPFTQFGGEHSNPWDLKQPLPAALRSGPRWPPPRGGLF